MNPQGSQVVNVEFFDSLIAKVNSVKTCHDLEVESLRAIATLAASNDAINSELAKLAPLAALMTVPTSPSEMLSWASNFITGFLGPYIEPIAKYTAMLAILTEKSAELIAVIEHKKDSITDCTFTIPGT